jgi:hypothetical protein
LQICKQAAVIQQKFGRKSKAPWVAAHEDRSTTHGYEATREAATQAFAKSWQEKKEGPLA